MAGEEVPSATAREPSVMETLTLELMHRFYQGDTAWLAARFAPELSAIGAQADQYAIGAQDILANALAVPDVVFTKERYEETYRAQGVSVVTGEYAAYVTPGQGMAFADAQRVSAVWRDCDVRPLLVHWHLSNPMGSVMKGERFPCRMASGVLRAVSLLAEQKRYRREITVQDVEGVTHRFLPFDLSRLEACGHNTLLYMASGACYTVHRGMAALLREAGLDAPDSGFVRVHRGHMVNVLYVRSVSDRIVMVDGAEVPIPARKVAAVREALAAARVG